MDSRVGLLKAFYGGLPTDRAKVETSQHGFPFLNELLSDGVTLEYGELTLSGLLHKYKLANIPAHRMDGLLLAHIQKACNVCLYFHARANDIFCFNLDNNHKKDNTRIIPEMELAVRTLRVLLTEAGCEPMVIASGRGYHAWCRLDAPAANQRLYDLMLHVAARTLAKLHEAGHDHLKIKFNFYPDVRLHDAVSLRLFGSEHAKNKVFSRALTPDGLLDEKSSWDWFERYLASKTISEAALAAACASFCGPAASSEQAPL
jgi:hypothetical protein